MIIIFERHQAPSDDLSPSSSVFHPDKILYECLFHQIDPIKMYQNSSFVNLSLSSHNNAFTFKIWPKLVCDFFLNISIPMSSGVRSPSSPFKPSDAANRSHDLPAAERRWLLSICVCICTFVHYCIFSYMLSLYFDFFVYYVNMCSVYHLMMRRDGYHICGSARNFNGLLTSVAGSSERWSSQLCVPHAIEITNQKLVAKSVRK